MLAYLITARALIWHQRTLTVPQALSVTGPLSSEISGGKGKKWLYCFHFWVEEMGFYLGCQKVYDLISLM